MAGFLWINLYVKGSFLELSYMSNTMGAL
jgi:hypothetical protein